MTFDTESLATTQRRRSSNTGTGVGRTQFEILLTIYAKCMSGRDQAWFDRIDRALTEGQ